MSGPWTVVFYADGRGREPVRELLDELERRQPGEYGAVRFRIDLLERFGVFLEEPYTRQLSGKPRELRAGPWRITYFADPRRRLVLLTSFRKSGRKTDPAEIRRALALMKDWLRRMRGNER
jgi:phage-related protein